jgi:hypothetical protein
MIISKFPGGFRAELHLDEKTKKNSKKIWIFRNIGKVKTETIFEKVGWCFWCVVGVLNRTGDRGKNAQKGDKARSRDLYG